MSNALTNLDKNMELIVQEDLPDLLKPMRETIYLDSVYVAGISYLEDPDLPESLKPGEALRLIREPKNAYDRYAVRIDNQNGEKIGYIPRRSNRVYARLMDAGKMITAKVAEVSDTGRYCAIKADLYLEDF